MWRQAPANGGEGVWVWQRRSGLGVENKEVPSLLRDPAFVAPAGLVDEAGGRRVSSCSCLRAARGDGISTKRERGGRAGDIDISNDSRQACRPAPWFGQAVQIFNRRGRRPRAAQWHCCARSSLSPRAAATAASPLSPLVARPLRCRCHRFQYSMSNALVSCLTSRLALPRKTLRRARLRIASTTSARRSDAATQSQVAGKGAHRPTGCVERG